MAPGSATRVVFRYTDARDGPPWNIPVTPMGRRNAVAGVTDETGLVLGLMPHPERVSLPAHYSQDGLKLFTNLVKWLNR